MVTVKLANGHVAETGCYVDGRWGVYGPHRACEQAAHIAGTVYEGPADTTAEAWIEIADQAEADLNEITPDGFIWGWHDGEFYLSPMCDDGECDDPTCAHWEG